MGGSVRFNRRTWWLAAGGLLLTALAASTAGCGTSSSGTPAESDAGPLDASTGGDAATDAFRDGSNAVDRKLPDGGAQKPYLLSCTHFASPTGGGNGLSQSAPFLISDFWSVAKPGDTLCLLDGTYTGADSMVQPPQGLSGSDGQPITVAALHDGAVFIDGQGARSPVQLNSNDWFIVEGFDMANAKTTIGSWENSVSRIADSHDVIMRRIVGWNSADGNTDIFGSDYSNNILFEDVAGFGVARKIVQLGHRGDSNFDDTDQNIIGRRVYARLEKSSLNNDSTCGQAAISVGYNTNGDIIENSIANVAGYFGIEPSCPGSHDNIGFHDDRNWDERNQILGSIAFRTADQSVQGTPTYSLLNADSDHMKVRDVLVAVEGQESTYDQVLESTARLGTYREPGYSAQFITLIGGPGSWVDLASDTVISNLIAMDATWNQGASSTGEVLVPATALLTPIASHPPTDYVMAYGNTQNWNVQPKHYSVTDPDLIGRCGNLLQYGCSSSERPTVDGQPVGAQIQCRYENGVLTDKPLWPWPMNERIRIATCAYDENQTRSYCAKHAELGVNVTKTVFELGGGHVPDFAALNPVVCPGTGP